MSTLAICGALVVVHKESCTCKTPTPTLFGPKTSATASAPRPKPKHIYFHFLSKKSASKLSTNAIQTTLIDTKELEITMNTIFSIWPEDERDRKRAPLRG